MDITRKTKKGYKKGSRKRSRERYYGLSEKNKTKVFKMFVKDMQIFLKKRKNKSANMVMNTLRFSRR